MAPRSVDILVVGDPHFRPDNARATQVLADLVVSAAADVDAVVVLGDILDRHDKIDLHCLTRATAFLARIHGALARRGGTLVVIVGNHDRPNNADFLSDKHPFGALRMWPRTVVAATACESFSVGGHAFAAVPYVPVGRFEEAMGGPGWPARLRVEGVRAVFAHQEFRGARLGAVKSRHGDLYPAEEAPLCISGHIHEYSKLPGVVYPGAPIDTGWAPARALRSPRGVMRLAVDAAGAVETRRVHLRGIPRSVLVTVDGADGLAAESEAIAAAAAAPGTARLRVRVRCKRGEFAAVAARAQLPPGAQIVPEYTDARAPALPAAPAPVQEGFAAAALAAAAAAGAGAEAWMREALAA